MEYSNKNSNNWNNSDFINSVMNQKNKQGGFSNRNVNNYSDDQYFGNSS
jgi:hypothetical protein